MKKFKTTHGLQIKLAANTEQGQKTVFKVGTVTGVFTVNHKTIVVETIIDTVAGNGHHIDALEWMHGIAKEGGRVLFIPYKKSSFTNTEQELLKSGLIRQKGGSYTKSYAKKKIVSNH